MGLYSHCFYLNRWSLEAYCLLHILTFRFLVQSYSGVELSPDVAALLGVSATGAGLGVLHNVPQMFLEALATEALHCTK